MSPKEKVRAEIYRNLLNEEKRKNKNMSVFSVGLFFVGIIGGTGYTSLVNSVPNVTSSLIASNINSKEDELVASMYKDRVINKKSIELNPDELFIYKTQI